MRTSLIAYFSTMVVFFGLDFVWISLTSKSLYKAQLGSLMREKPDLTVAAGFYLGYCIAVTVFAVMPAIEEGNWIRALWAGALFGITAYGCYDLTNQATIVGWSSVVTIADMAWGTFATALAATVGFYITRAFS